APHVHGDLLAEVAVGDRGRDLRDVAHLAGEVAGHGVDGVGEVLPGAGHALDLGLAAEASVRADLAGHPGDFGSERRELVHHRVDGDLQLQDLALDVDRDLLGEVAGGHGLGDVRDVADLHGERARHHVDGVGEVLPGAGHARDFRLPAQLAFRADLAGHARDLGGERAQLIHHRVHGVLQLQDLALHVDRDLAREVAGGHGLRHFRDVADLGREVPGHRVHVVGEVLPGAGDALDVGLSAQLAL